MPDRVLASEYERAVSELRDELERLSVQDADALRLSALADVTDWRWSELGAPGVGDIDTDLRVGTRSHWLEAPPPDDNDQYGLDVGGRVRVIRRRIQANVVVVEYSPRRIRHLVIDDTGVRGIQDVHLDGARYVTAVGVNSHGWDFSSFEYDGDRFVSVWTAMYVEDDEVLPGLRVMTRTASYGLRGRFRKLNTVLESFPEPGPLSPPSAPRSSPIMS